ncbi:hypothetical protein LTR95_003322 [Oleoguttula sp. CCFEE 5521]
MWLTTWLITVPKLPSPDPTSRIAKALQEAVAILRNHFPDAYDLVLTRESADQRLEKSSTPAAALLIASGETLTAALLVHLLSSALHDHIIHTMSVGSTDEDLFKRGDQLVGKCGAIYYIDANGVDLEYRLRAASKGYTGVEGFRTIVDLTGFMGDNPSLKEMLVEGGVYVNWKADKEGMDLAVAERPMRPFEEVVRELDEEVLEYSC